MQHTLYFSSEYFSKKSAVKTFSKNVLSLLRASSAPFSDTGSEPMLYSRFFQQKVCKRFLLQENLDLVFF